MRYRHLVSRPPETQRLLWRVKPAALPRDSTPASRSLVLLVLQRHSAPVALTLMVLLDRVSDWTGFSELSWVMCYSSTCFLASNVIFSLSNVPA